MASAEHQKALQEGVEKELSLYKFPTAGQKPLRTLSFQDTCLFRGAIGGVMGGALGAAFGILMSSMNPPGMSGMAGGGGGGGMMPTGMINPMNPQMATGPVRPPAAAAAAATMLRPPPGAAAALTSSAIAAAAPSAAAAAASSASSATAAAVSAMSSLPATMVSAASHRPILGPHPLPAMPIVAVSPMDPIYGGKSALETTSWQQMKTMARDTGRQAKGNFKTWGIMSGTYATSECLIESARGTSDDMNPLLAGCATGAFLAARSGPQGVAFGCAGFATFSYAMEKVMHAM